LVEYTKIIILLNKLKDKSINNIKLRYMSLREIVNNFNQQADDLMIQMYECSLDNDIKIYHNMFKKLKRYNATKAIEQFIIYVVPHKERIYNNDDTFFLSQSEKDLIGDESDYTMMQSLKFKDLWITLTEISKENIFKFFKIMIYYAEEFLKLKYPIAC